MLNTASEIPNYHETEGKFKYLHLTLHDDKDDDLNAEFARCNEFIHGALDGGGAIFVHCQAGISRSASIIIGYLMAREGMSLREAWLLAKSKRDNVGPNEHFMRALTLYENELRPSERRGEPPSFTMEEYYTSTLVSMGF